MRRMTAVAAILCLAAGVLAGTATQPGRTGDGFVRGIGTTSASIPSSAPVGQPMRVVYVVDRSGLFPEDATLLTREMERALENLVPEQRFGLIVCDDGAEAEILTAGPNAVQATPEVRCEVIAKLGRVPKKGLQDSEIIPIQDGFQKALAMKPEVIYFLAEGRFDPRVIEQVRKLNAGARKVPIHTIAFLGQDDGYFDQLKQIAADSGGKFKYVSKKDAAGPARTTRGATEAGTQAVQVGPRIVYVLDHSGSLVDNFNSLQAEVRRSIDGLGSDAMFGVIVFNEDYDARQDGAKIDVLTPGDGMARATEEAKKVAGAKLNTVKAKGAYCDGIAAVSGAFQKAFAMKPDIIYFVTDGRIWPGAIETVVKLNHGERKVRINTIAFVGKDDGYFDQMKEIAKDSGGTFTFVSERDVGKPGWWPEGVAAATEAGTRGGG